eukprot:CAMPEP_0113943122 /NCGR_PEP_ID=MMETSP1339-20121228/19190_1 /TAXON_ID=94617 /ORGANISM="Fibrocapsa japonica" /LENGTH=183 /DNA_ID=CAMNT_0000947899 /DNA_START=201 /DNA_END=752 /DNA_ORIENTATION=- /assembly_acc=CAM_ASM_000762
MALAEGVQEGTHGVGNRYMPCTQLRNIDIQPRIIQVAGVWPDLSPEDVMAPQSSPAPPSGTWQYDFSDPDGPQMGTVAIEGSDLVESLEDPVAIVCPNTHLGVPLPQDETAELLVIVDRAETEFSQYKFFCFAKPDGTIEFRWHEALPEGYSILGKVMLVQSPFLPSMASAKTGYLEADDDDF